MKNKIGIIIVGAAVAAAIGFGGYYIGSTNNQKASNPANQEGTEAANKNMTIAVVNLDEGSELPGKEKIYYGEKIIRFPDDTFVYTSLEEARQGIENGSYSAYVIVPSNFSSSVDSLNGTPTQANFQYALNTDLNGEIQKNALYQVMKFGESLNTDLSYMYLANILQEFHQAQDEASQVMENDLKDKTAIDDIRASDLVKMVSVPELTREENSTAPLEISTYTEANSSFVNEIDEKYKFNVEDAKTQLTSINDSSDVLSDSLKGLTERLGEINLTTDEEGNNLYEGGKTALSDSLMKYNSDLSEDKVNAKNSTYNAETQREIITDELEKSINDYNRRLDTETATYLSKYKKSLGEALPPIKYEEISDTEYKITCDQIEGKEPAPVVTVSMVPAEVDDELILANKSCIEKIVSRIATAADTGEMEEIEIENPNPTPTPNPNPDASIDPDTNPDSNPDPVPDIIIHSVNKSILKIFQECDEDVGLMAEITSCGYTSAQEMFSAYASGNIQTEATYRIKVDGDIALLNNYITSALDTVDATRYVSTEYKGIVVDDSRNVVKSVDGDTITISTLLEDYKSAIEAINNQVASINEIQADGITEIVDEQCIIPLVDRTESVKASLQNRYNDGTVQVKDYQKVLNSYNPQLDTSKISEAVSEMKANGSKMQQSVMENNQAYVEFANKTYKTTQENTTKLQTHVQEVKEAGENAVETGLSEAKTTKFSTSRENQESLAEFSQKLSFTRLGTMEYTQAYEFIASPLLLTQVSDYQRLKDDVSTKAAEAKINKSEQTNNNKQYVQIVLYTLFIILILISIAAYIIRTKKLYKYRLHSTGN